MGGGNDSNVQRSGTRINKDEQDAKAKESLYVGRNDANQSQQNKDLGHFQTLNLPSKQTQPFLPPPPPGIASVPQMLENNNNPALYNMNTYIKDPQGTLEYQCRVQHQQIQQQQYQLQQLQHLQLQLQYQLQLQQQQYHQQLELLQQTSSKASEKTEAKRPENGDGNDSNGNRLEGNVEAVDMETNDDMSTNRLAENSKVSRPVNGNERASSAAAIGNQAF
eukprot:TRINITY_DN370_c0_g1_i3.p1 TRINITY_DN370_c0_g1~~TRINITY_DN370_c0_g1_i3.p1  ORF type:complete len:221 (-),score=38.90 TRINITY_DN370_c0_g1_i3:544-1206(-)